MTLTPHPVYNDAEARHVILTQIAPLVPQETVQRLLDVVRRDEIERLVALNERSGFQPGWPTQYEREGRN